MGCLSTVMDGSTLTFLLAVSRFLRDTAPPFSVTAWSSRVTVLCFQCFLPNYKRDLNVAVVTRESEPVTLDAESQLFSQAVLPAKKLAA